MAMKLLDVRKHNETLLSCIDVGDLIEFPRGHYSHWAVYIGNEEVVHLSGDENDGINGQIDAKHFFTISGQRFGKAIIKVENFWSVVGGTKAEINNTKDKKYKPLPKAQIVKNALERIGRVGYNVLFENCEHFTSLCRYGENKSEQVDNFLTGMAVLTAIGATAGILLGLSRSSKDKEDPQDL
ncbi:hypothetical protein ACOMHN_056794 [Nucella lapillus]